LEENIIYASPRSTPEMTKKPGEYMFKELTEGPSKVLDTLRDARGEVEAAARLIEDRCLTRAFIIGSGTSFHASLYLQYLLTRHTDIHAAAIPASEFEDWIPQRRNYLIIGYSQSGESSDIVWAFQQAKEKGVTTIAITNTPGSTLTKLADASIVTRAGEEKAVAATKTFDVQLTAALMLAYTIAGKPLDPIADAAREAEKILGAGEIPGLAEKHSGAEHAYILGKAAGYPIALEAALKLKEAAMVHAEGFAAREFLHGPVQLVDETTPVFLYAPSREAFKASMKAVDKIAGYKAPIIAVGPREEGVAEKAAAWIEVGVEGDEAVLPLVKAAQLYAYHVSLLRGKDPDAPSKLSKVVKY